jgi:RNA polymerase sigma-70 factor, ECF subfamily
MAEFEFEAERGFLENLRRRDAEALDRVVTAYLPHVVQAAHGAGFSAHDADDLAQETFATFFSAIAKFEGRSKIRTFLLGIMFSKARERRRQMAQRDRKERLHSDFAPSDDFDAQFLEDGHWREGPAQIAVDEGGEGFRGDLKNCLEGLDETPREVFVLTELEDLDRSEICEILGITKSNLGVILHRARHALRGCLSSKLEGSL